MVTGPDTVGCHRQSRLGIVPRWPARSRVMGPFDRDQIRPRIAGFFAFAGVIRYERMDDIDGDADAGPDRPIEARWRRKAERNVDRWGVQDVETILLAMQEEHGELAQAFLEARDEGGDRDRIIAELDDLAALCVQLAWRLRSTDPTETA